MAKFVKAPEPPPEPEAESQGWIEGTAASLGIETGAPGALCLALAAVLALYALLRLAGFLYQGTVARYAEGEVVEGEPALGGGFHPVIAVTDASGRRRRVVSEFRTADDPTGRRVRMRVDGGRPRPAPPPKGAVGQLLAIAIPLALAAALAGTGTTGHLAGLPALPRVF